jgi:altronate dehydratase
MSTGFVHDNRGVGIRHHQLILPSVVCSTRVSKRIADDVGAVTFAHQHGCGIIGDDVSGIGGFFADLASHPNVGSVLIVGLGCETIQGQELGAQLISVNPSTKYQIIQDSGGVEGTVSSGIKSAKELDATYPIVKGEAEKITVGIDLANQHEIAEDLIAAITDLGMDVAVATDSTSSTENFSHLMRAKAHVIISFPSENQPASGFPLIPVINIPSKSALHAAISKDFDLASNVSVSSIIEKLFATIEGAPTKAELSKAGEIRAPRVTRSA